MGFECKRPVVRNESMRTNNVGSITLFIEEVHGGDCGRLWGLGVLLALPDSVRCGAVDGQIGYYSLLQLVEYSSFFVLFRYSNGELGTLALLASFLYCPPVHFTYSLYER